VPQLDFDAPLVVVTTDSHIGPRLREDLRPYCPKKYLEEYDAYIELCAPASSDPVDSYFRVFNSTIDEETLNGNEATRVSLAALRRNATAGHYDAQERVKDMDRDGVAAEVVFHGSQNGHSFPFLDPTLGTFNALHFSPNKSPHELELAAVGIHMYNQFLADQCSTSPGRHIGLMHLPMWDIEAAVRELEWAYGAGLRGVNFPAPKAGIRPYDDLAWDPFWGACEERGLVLTTHDGAGIDDMTVTRAHTHLAVSLEGDLTRKLFPRLIFGGTFERFPNLKLVLTELENPASAWWVQTARRYDQIWEVNRKSLSAQAPRRPSDYMANNIFLGQSFLHAVPAEVTVAVERGYASNFTWGSDYPHQEGVYRHVEDDETEPRTRSGLRAAFCQAPPEAAIAMIGATAAKIYSCDLDDLAAVARRINAITLRELAVPPAVIPDEWALTAQSQHLYPEFHGAAALPVA
jgi:predicted TIM-barrel fold metal-dependent hydrolase